jgi:hypothetical protein
MYMNVHVFFSHTSTDKTIGHYKDGKIANIKLDQSFEFLEGTRF